MGVKGHVCISLAHCILEEKLLWSILQCVRHMMLVDNFVVGRLCVNMLRRIERLRSMSFFYFLLGKVTAPELDNNAPLAVGFLDN